jgi:tetratricopeptide (TPR) repeat protein
MKGLPIALALVWAAPASALQHEALATGTQQDQDQVQVDKAADLIHSGKPAEAVALLDSLIAAQEKSRQGDPQDVYCARSPVESLLYGGQAAQQKHRAVVLPQSGCYSYFLKGFALIDMKRPDEAKPWFDRALAMAPQNAQFIAELAEWYKSRRDWDMAQKLFARAEAASALSPKDSQLFDKTRGMRGQAFVLIERGKLDEAEKLYREVLKLNPNDERAKQELQYIAEHKGKTI